MAQALCRFRRFFRGLAFFVALGSLAVTTWAVNPTLGSLAPYGARRGGEVVVSASGARLKDFQGVLLYYPGITYKKHAVVNDGKVDITFDIAPNCRLGNHAIRLLTNTGISNLQLFSVGALEETEEKEPNNEFDKPQEIKLDVTINGTTAVEDIDYFSVEAKKGERISAEVEGIRLGRANFDPYVAIFNDERFELSGSDDSALLWHDSVASIVAPADGKYIVAVRESSFNVAGAYRLHIGRFPRPLGVMPAGGKPGEKVELTWLGDPSGPIKQTVTLPKEREPYSWIFSPDKNFTPVFAQDAKGTAPSPQLFRLDQLSNTLEVEPNNDVETATLCQAPGACNGIINQAGDVDHFKFTAKKGDSFGITVRARSLGSPLDSVLTVRRGAASMGSNDDTGSPDSYMRFNAPADGEYTLAVNDLLKQGGPQHFYRVEIAPIEPALALGLPERIQYQDVTTSLPQGNRMAFMVSASRRDFGGDVKLDFKNLPKGVSFETVDMPGNQTMVPVLMTVTADAPLAGHLVDVVGTSLDPKVSLSGHLLQESQLVRGNNNRPVFTHSAYAMATNVVEKVPYSIEVVEPKVPLVRNGSMALKVRAKRTGDFKGPIAVRMLYNPPGVAAQGGVSIAEGQSEADILMTANSNADIRSWKIAIIGEANPGDGNVMVSSQLAKLDVADAYFTFAFKPGAAEQGNEGNLVVTINHNTEFAGKAKVELAGLPAEATSEPLQFDKDTEQIVFNIKTTAKTPPGKHKSLVVKAVVTLNGEPIEHTIGPTEFRVDTPLPPKPVAANKPATAPAAAANPVAAAKPAVAKPLSRLEQLRQGKETAPAAAQQQQQK